MEKRLFTSESVTEGHPDKICDQISDAILDALLLQDPMSRVACETCITTGLIVVIGEITTKAHVDIQKIVRDTVREIGYNRGKYGFDADTCGVIVALDEQSADIALGVDQALEAKENNDQQDKEILGAGDQGMMFGYATNETEQYMPYPIAVAHQLVFQLSKVRKEGILPYLRPDGKSQVTVEYDENYKPIRIDTVVLSTQHNPNVTQEQIHRDIKTYVFNPILPKHIYVKKLKKKVPNITVKEWSELYELYQKNPNAEIPVDLLKEMLKNIGQIPNEIKDNMQMDIISKVFESGGKSVVKLGEIFLSTGIQGPATENSFVILSNSFAQQSGKLINTGTKLQSFGKVGMPIIGTAIDFGGQLISGEEVGDAAVKTAGHFGVGLIAGKLGAMAGTAAAATLAVGPVGVAAIGIAAGAVIAVFGSRAFDHAYENNWLGIKDIGKEINEVVDDVKKGLSNVGKAVSGFFDGLGNAFA